MDYKKVAEQVYTATGTREAMKALGYKAPSQNAIKHTFTLGKNRVFDPDKPEEYIKSFSIRKA